MGGIGSTELLILLVVLVAAGLVVVRSRVAANRNRRAGRAAPVRGIASAAPPAVVADVAPRSIEARLAELETLRSRGVINDEEYASARTRALEGPAAS